MHTCGYRTIQVFDCVQNTNVEVNFLYPASGEERTENFGPYSLDVAKDATIVGDNLPLVIFSHGNGGSSWGYRDLAKLIVGAGYVVALVEHTGNCRSDNSKEKTLANLENRPRHISRVIDASFADPIIGRHLAAGRIAVIGHSMGGYTALAIAGGKPWAAPHETPDQKPCPVKIEPDNRIRSIVLLTPATPWFNVPDGLTNARVPVLMFSGEKDTVTPATHAETVINGLPDRSKLKHVVIPNAGHFSVMSKVPASMASPDFLPSTDPEGFDRDAYRPTMFAEIRKFLAATLVS